MTDTEKYADYLADSKDAEIQKRLARGDKPHGIYENNGQILVAWDIEEKVARDGAAPVFDKATKGIVPISGRPYRTDSNIPFVIISGKTQGGRIEISRDLLAPAKLAAKELQTMGGNDIREGFWYNSMIANRSFIEGCDPIERNRFKGQPVVIVGAGPSIEKQTGLLEDCEFPTLLTNAAITMLDPADKLFLSIDWFGRRDWFAGLDLSRTDAIFDVLSADIAVNQGWRSRRWFRQTYAAGMANEAAAKWYPRLPLLDPGHCVAYAALGLALWWGADPIIFTGMDFSFGPDNKVHAGEDDDSADEAYRQAHGYIPCTDIYGNPTATNHLYKAAAEHVHGSVKLTSVYGGMWARRVPRFINCTEQGIFRIPNKMPLGECLDACRSDLASMQGTPLPRLPKALINPLKKLQTNSKKSWIAKAITKKDSYWSCLYQGPDSPETVETGVLRGTDAKGNDVPVLKSEVTNAA